ncbi:heme exporter protein CcmD [Salinispirillum marinum]|uniref:Heme exporter protein D n=2 Tax=Saccharospirillaceae TaxID=255527 RepID=A0ABV8BEU4_9GAMM
MGQFETFADFVRMGRHGIYVWSVYGITLVVIAGHLISLRLQKRRLLREYRKMKKRGAV